MLRKMYERVPPKMRPHIRFATFAWLLALPFMYAILIWGQWNSDMLKGGWFTVATLPLMLMGMILGGMWFVAIHPDKTEPEA